MRDIILVGAVAVIIPFILRWPHVGILAFTWISIMNPHRLTYGFAYGLPYALLFFVITSMVWLLSKERKIPPLVTLTWVLLTLSVWIAYTTYHAWLPDVAFYKLDRTIKIILGAVLTAILIDRKARVIQFVWVLCISLGFYGVKGGFFLIVTGGDNRVWGAPDTFMEDNNALALALVMVVPLMYFLFQETKNRWLRAGVMVIALLTMASVLGTYSRGGLLALTGMAAFLWLKSRHKLVTLSIAFVIVLVAATYAPAGWQERMVSIQTFAEDPSFQSRIRAWQFALEVAEESPVTGGGFYVFQLNRVIEKGESNYLNAHSIYFEVIGEHGYVGLILFLLLNFSAFFSCSYAISRSQLYPDLAWAGKLGAMLQVSLAGYAIGGAALSLAFFDLLYFLIAMIISITGIVAAKELAQSGSRGWLVHSAWNSNAPASRRLSARRKAARAG